jgi:hypothetical protein
MRRLPTAAGLTLTVALAVLLSGCVEPDPVITPGPDSTATPVFESEEDALAAAEEAYAEYLEVSDLIASEGGVNPERFESVVTTDWLVREIESAQELERSGLQQIGESQLGSIELQQVDGSQSDLATVYAYVCLDLSEVSYVDDDGASSSPDEVLIPLEVSFEATAIDQVLVAGNEPWTGENFC